MAVSNPTLRQIVRRKFQRHSIPGQHADSIPAEFARQVCQHSTVLVELNAELSGRELLDNSSGNFNAVFFAHVPRKVVDSCLPGLLLADAPRLATPNCCITL